ncbi:MAG TPA: glycosyltransferase family 39 protein [Bryobacteraceae bacterium]|nr:glycosyltransferase family 39 protein [Bryobacteraceae bacterium]
MRGGCALTRLRRHLTPALHSRLWTFCAILLIGSSVAGIGKSWTSLSATYDEADHIAAGMEWLDKGTYHYETEHPPLARAVIALGPYLKGLRSSSLSALTAEGNAILYSAGNYRSNLASARSGNLIFLALACVSIFLWGRRWFGGTTAVWAVLLFMNLPPVLGHAGLATLDMACAATLILALYACIRCLEDFSYWRLTLFGAALAFAFLCKLSTIAFLGVCISFAIACVALQGRVPLRLTGWRGLPMRILVLAAVVFLVLWAGYRFRVSEVRLPLEQFFAGIRDVRFHNRTGHPSYLFGEYRQTGWWYFFPVVIGVKTPIGFLVLAVFGVFAIWRGLKSNPWPRNLTPVFAAAILLICMAARINLGVRHILAIYPFLALLGGYAVSESLLAARRMSPAVAALPIPLAVWTVADSWMARPDYLAWFNRFAGSHPENILAESDLDWGQDLYRLSERLQELRAAHVYVKYFGTAPLEKAGLPPFTVFSTDTPGIHGYAAISLRYLTLEYARDGSFAWLKKIRPQEIIGKSIYLYNLDLQATPPADRNSESHPSAASNVPVDSGLHELTARKYWYGSF